MMNAVKQRAQSYDEWGSHVTEVLEAKLDKKRSEFCFRKWIQLVHYHELGSFLYILPLLKSQTTHDEFNNVL